MKKINLLTKAEELLAVSVVLYFVALIVGITNGFVPLVLLLVAAALVSVTLIEAVRHQRSIYTILFRLGAFSICLEGVFENRQVLLLDVLCTLVGFICAIVLFVRFIFYLNKYGVRDAEAHLDD